MKRLLFFLAVAVGWLVQAQPTGSTLTFATIADMQAHVITGGQTSVAASVMDTNRGGLFAYTTDALTADGGVVFAATGVGSGFWKRQFKGPADARWWGVVPDDATDDSTALQSALNSFSVIELPKGIVTIDTRIALNDGNTLVGQGSGLTIIDATNCAVVGNYGPLTAIGSMARVTDDLYASVAIGATNLYLNPSAIGEVSANDLLLLHDNDPSFIPGISYTYKNQIIRVDHVLNGTNVCFNGARYAFTDDANTYLYKLTWKSVHLKGFSINTDDDTKTCVELGGVRSSTIEDVSITGGENVTLAIVGRDVMVDNLHIDWMPRRDFGITTADYGISMSVNGDGIRVLNSTFRSDAQGLTTSGEWAYAHDIGMNNLLVEGCTFNMAKGYIRPYKR